MSTTDANAVRLQAKEDAEAAYPERKHFTFDSDQEWRNYMSHRRTYVQAYADALFAERIQKGDVLKERDTLRAFVDALIQDVCWGRGLPDDMDGGSVQDMAVKMGVLVHEPHNLPCAKELCGCEGEEVDFLFNTPWRITAKAIQK